MRRLLALCLFIAASMTMAFAGEALAGRALLSEEVIPRGDESTPDQDQIEGACGLAIAPGIGFYLSDYYHGVVDLFTADGQLLSQTSVGLEPEGPCSLALDSTGALYVGLWHQGVVRLLPGPPLAIATDNVTGIAVDPATDYLYVDSLDENHEGAISVFEPSGAPLEVEGRPLQIGVGSLGESYGVAVAEGRVYVADATSETVKVFAADGDPASPIATIAHGFRSLIDSALAIDPGNGHLLVVDNRQPGYEHPRAGIFEFDSAAAGHVALGQLPGSPVHGEPSGIAVDDGGNLYVTDGNDELSSVYAYGPYQESPSLAPVSPATNSAIVTPLAAPSVQEASSPRPPATLRKTRRRRGRHHRHGPRVHAQITLGGRR